MLKDSEKSLNEISQLILSFCGFFLLLSACGYHEVDLENVVATDTANNQWVSQDGKYLAYVCSHSSGYGQNLLIKELESKKEKVILTSGRWIDVNWSPDSRYCAAIDHWDPNQSNVVIFDLSQGIQNVAILYETVSDSEHPQKWNVEKWDTKTEKKVILAKRTLLFDDPWEVVEYKTIDLN